VPAIQESAAAATARDAATGSVRDRGRALFTVLLLEQATKTGAVATVATGAACPERFPGLAGYQQRNACIDHKCDIILTL